MLLSTAVSLILFISMYLIQTYGLMANSHPINAIPLGLMMVGIHQAAYNVMTMDKSNRVKLLAQLPFLMLAITMLTYTLLQL